jgi:hypothetical protein
MTSVNAARGSVQRPPLGGSLAYLLMNLPLGVLWFTVLVTLVAVGVSTAIVWVGVPIAAFAVLLWRGGARVERARVYALLGNYIDLPYRSLPEAGQKQRWKARLRDAATWRDMAYLLLLLPLGILEFTLVVTFWSVSLALVALPVYYRYLPGGAYHFPDYGVRWVTVDSAWDALPWAAAGVLFVALSVTLTRAMAASHARLAQALLGSATAAAPGSIGNPRSPAAVQG